MTQLSNDIKWNKIKQIEEELGDTWIAYHYYSGSEKEANTKVWELANKLYDIATKGFYEEEYFSYSMEPISYAEYIADCNRLALGDWGRDHTSFVRSQIKEYRDDYEYSNS